MTADFSHRSLEEVPSEVLRMEGLEELDLRGNRLARIPAGIGRLERLQKLYLEGNPIAEMPLDIAEYPMAALIHLEAQRVFPLHCEPADSLFYGAAVAPSGGDACPVYDLLGTEPLRFSPFHTPPLPGEPTYFAQGMRLGDRLPPGVTYQCADVQRIVAEKLRGPTPQPWPPLVLIAARAVLTTMPGGLLRRSSWIVRIDRVYDVRPIWCTLR